MPKRITKLERELALALDVASRLNINPNPAIERGSAALWGNPSPFQEKINELLVRSGRSPVAPNTACTPTGGSAPVSGQLSTPENIPLNLADTTPPTSG